MSNRHTGAYSAAKDADFVKWGCRVDLGNTSSMNNSVLAEGRGPDKMVNGLPILREPCVAITNHGTSVSIDPKEITHVAFLRLAMAALPALACEHGEHMVSRLKFGHTLTNALHDSTTQIIVIVNFVIRN